MINTRVLVLLQLGELVLSNVDHRFGLPVECVALVTVCFVVALLCVGENHKVDVAKQAWLVIAAMTWVTAGRDS